MLQVWLLKGDAGATGTTDDTMLLALHVLSGAGFGISYSFESELTTPAAGHKMSYRDALADDFGACLHHNHDRVS